MSLLTGLAKGRDILPRREKEPLVAEAAAESSKVRDRCGFSRKPRVLAWIDRHPTPRMKITKSLTKSLARPANDPSCLEEPGCSSSMTSRLTAHNHRERARGRDCAVGFSAGVVGAAEC